MQGHQTVSGSDGTKREYPDLTLTRSCYPSGTRLQSHSHERAILSFAISGATLVSVGGVTEWCDQDALLYLPAGAPHTNVYPETSRRLHIEVNTRFWSEVSEGGATISAGGAIRHAVVRELRSAAAAAFENADNLTTFDLAISVSDTIGLLTCARTSRPTRGDHWLLRLREFLSAHCTDPLSMAVLANVTGRHPVHVSREFRRHFGKTISEFVRQRRLVRAAQMLRENALSLAAIAAECGFCDQSHFTNAFRKTAGVTPAVFRERGKLPTSDARPLGRHE